MSLSFFSLRQLYYYIFALALLSTVAIQAQILDTSGSTLLKEQIIRDIRLRDLQKNMVSNVDFYTTNYGILGLNVDGNAAGIIWPRGSLNTYVFGGGIWFGTLKYNKTSGKVNKLMLFTYNPNSGASRFVPGHIADGDKIDISVAGIRKNPTQFSTDHTTDGTPIDSKRANWPIWYGEPEKTPGVGGYTGNYVADPTQRTMTVYPKGPVVLSDEDIVNVYKSSDIAPYKEVRLDPELGYPLRTEIVETIYSWGQGDLKDAFIVCYELTNKSEDTLRDCWIAPMMDFWLSYKLANLTGRKNDHARFYYEDPSLDLALLWTDLDQQEKGKGFGYVGLSLLATPAVDANGMLRTDKPLYGRTEQLGLQTFRNWTVTPENSKDNPKNDSARYNFMSSGIIANDTSAGNRWLLMASGPFHLLPNQRVRMAIGFAFARGSKGRDCDGSSEDAVALAELTRKLRQKYEQSLYGSVVDVQEPVAHPEDILKINGIYPNPTSTVSRLDFSVNAPSDVTIEIVDITGQTVLSHRKTLQSGTYITDVDLATFSQGMYTCRISARGIVKTVLLSIVR